MAWNAATNKWTAPTTSFNGASQEDLWRQFLASTTNYSSMNGAQKSRAFLHWWNTSGSGAWKNAWQTAYNPWQETMQGWMNDPDRQQTEYAGAMPETPDFTSIGQRRDEQLYGNGSTTGIYDIMSRLAAELEGGSQQYSDEWMQQYADQAGFESPEAREQWLQEQRANQETLQGRLMSQVENPSQITPDQQKQIRAIQREQEAAARKQAEAMYQETGSYAVLQRASDELNRAAVSDSFKMQMDMALQNYSTTMSALEQQTNSLMREVEAGTQSFQYYVQAKQQGVMGALEAYQAQAQTMMAQYEQEFNAMQTSYSNEMGQYQEAQDNWETAQALLNSQGDLIMTAAAEAMGGTADMKEAMEQYYSSVIQPMLDEFTLDTNIETAEAASQTAKTQTGINALLTGLGVILFLVPGGQLLGGSLIAAGVSGLSKVDYGAMRNGSGGNTTPSPANWGPETAAPAPSNPVGGGGVTQLTQF